MPLQVWDASYVLVLRCQSGVVVSEGAEPKGVQHLPGVPQKTFSIWTVKRNPSYNDQFRFEYFFISVSASIDFLRLFSWKTEYLKCSSTGGGFFHSKGTWGCAAREGILFRTSSLAKGVLFGNFSRVRSRQGYAFWEFWPKRCQNSVIFVKKPNFLKILV